MLCHVRRGSHINTQSAGLHLLGVLESAAVLCPLDTAVRRMRIPFSELTCYALLDLQLSGGAADSDIRFHSTLRVD